MASMEVTCDSCGRWFCVEIEPAVGEDKYCSKDCNIKDLIRQRDLAIVAGELANKRYTGIRAELDNYKHISATMFKDLDCGDNSCMFAAKRGGMRTNGGCTCLRDPKPQVRRNIQWLWRLHKQEQSKESG